MLRPRSWILLPPLLLCGCKPAPVVVTGAAPTPREAAALAVDIAVGGGEIEDCVAAVTRPVDANLWPYYLSLYRSGLVHSDDPRFQAISRRWDRAKADQPAQIRLTAAVVGKRFRIVDDPDAEPACRVLHTYRQPVFDGDLAFVAVDTRIRDMAGGSTNLSIYRVAGRRWSFVATSDETFGQPIL